MQLLDNNNHPYPAEISVQTDGDGFTAYFYDDNGNAIECMTSLVPAGMQNISPQGTTFFGSRSGSPWIGSTVGGFYASGAISAIITAAAFSVTYVPPFSSLNDSVNRATLTATSPSGNHTRSIMIQIQPALKGKF